MIKLDRDISMVTAYGVTKAQPHSLGVITDNIFGRVYYVPSFLQDRLAPELLSRYNTFRSLPQWN